MKIDKMKYKMGFAEQAALASHDAETKVGAALFKKDGTFVGMGYNGFVRGANDEKLPNIRPEKYKFMIHAEQNLIVNCARNGISMENTELFCTMSPCVLCMRLLWQAGVTTVYCKELYRDIHEILGMQDLAIEVKQIPHGWYKITYKEGN